MNKKASQILLGAGVGLAILICVISIALYGKVYFFDGYDITKFAWIVSFGCMVCSLIAFVSESNGWIIGLVVVLVIALVVACSGSTGSSSSSGSSNNDSNSGSYRCNNCGGDGWDSANGCSCVWCGGDGRTSWNP